MEIDRIAAEMQLARFAQKTQGLMTTETHLKVLSFFDQTDKYTLLGLIDNMVDDLARNGLRALGQNVQNLSKRQALLLLGDLRRWFIINYCNDVVENCDKLCECQRRAAMLEAENIAMKSRLNDGWSDRVTFENVVEQIAACEDTKERDEARKIFEPMLKREMARKLRAEIKRKVNESNISEGSRTFNNYGTYNEVQAGGTNITNNHKYGGD